MNYEDLIVRTRQLTGRYQASEDCRAGDVAAIIVSASGREYSGVCIEFEAGIGFCAEHAAVAEMLKAHESVARLIVAVDKTGVVTPPCGRCRELLWQLNEANRKMLVVLDDTTAKPLAELLPYR